MQSTGTAGRAGYRNVGAGLAGLCILLVSYAGTAAPTTFEQAKVELRNHVYYDQARAGALGTLYCGCNWVWVGRSGGRVDFASCGYKVRAQENRAIRTEFEHLVPANFIGKHRRCWQEGGRQNCVRTDPVFNVIEADMHNLSPVVGEINADRSNFRMGMLPGAPLRHGDCDFKVDFKARVVEPRDEVKGLIARVHFYVYDRYGIRMSEQQQKLFMAWDRQFPVSAWELERDRRIGQSMGHSNPFVTGARQWTLGHKTSAEGFLSGRHEMDADEALEKEYAAAD